MPVWRCPHCGTPQSESSRCWVCRRSTTTCATCRHFRRGIASGLGLCGLDPRRAALDGTEIRACWTAAPAHGAGGGDDAMDSVPGPTAVLAFLDDRRPARTFVPVDELEASRGAEAVTTADPADENLAGGRPVAAGGVRSGPDGWSLWGDAEG